MRRQLKHRVNFSFISNFLFSKQTILLLGILGSVAVIFLMLATFPINKINCRLENDTCPDETNQLLQPLVGKSIFFTDFDSELVKLFTNQPFKLIKIQKQLPGQLIVQLKPLDPIYNLVMTDQTLAVDSEGNILAQQMPNLPNLVVKNNCPILPEQQQINLKMHQQLMMLWKQLQIKKIAPLSVSCLSTDLVVIKLANQPQFLLHPDDLSVQTQKLIVLINSLQLNTFDPEVKEVDLRFKQPILRENLTIND
jgi:cell division septal protein FtsQ